MVRQITAVNILLGGVLLGLLATGPALGMYVPLKGHTPEAKSVRQAGRDAKGTDELKAECIASGGIYLTTNGECINVE